MSQAAINRIWARGLLQSLQTAGVEHICIAPGSRSTPLALEALVLADSDANIHIHTHFDERGLGFLALGLAKASKKPVAVIVTSGTAVANLLPATVESGLTREPLVLLTSDRPPELVGVGANQAILQTGIFSSHVTQSVLLESPSPEKSLPQMLSPVLDALAKQAVFQGSLHINCPYPEPLYVRSEDELIAYQELLAEVDTAWQKTALEQAILQWHKAIRQQANQGDELAQLTQLAAKIKDCPKGLVVIGSLSLEQAQAARAFAERLGWPVLADPQSGVSTPWQHYDIWLQSDECAATLASSELIVQFGARLVSKRLLAWIKQQVNVQSADYWLIEPSVTVLNPDHLAQQRIRADICDSLDQLQGQLSISARLEAGKDTLSSDALSLAARCQRQFPVWSNHDVLTECQFAQRLPELLNQTPSADLFLGNSLIVRLVDMLTCLPDCEVFTNRGASGIDGLLATAFGVQRARQRMQLCILGDTSTLYDLNSLALLSQTSQPFVLVVLNNDGGAIFDLLPVPDAQKKTLYQMPHGFEFSGAAQQFQLNYGLVQTFEQIMTKIKAYQNAFKQNQTHSGLILELQTPSGQAGQDLQAIVKAVTHHVS